MNTAFNKLPGLQGNVQTKTPGVSLAEWDDFFDT